MTNPIPTPKPKSLTPSARERANCATPASPPDSAAYQRHCREFHDEYQPDTPTERQLTRELADTAWRLNRIPMLEAALLDRAANPPTELDAIDFDIVDAHRDRPSRTLRPAPDTSQPVAPHRTRPLSYATAPCRPNP